jgi:hypothetical protein
VHIEHATLPLGIECLDVHELQVGDACVDLCFRNVGEKVVVVPRNHQRGRIQVLAHL